MNPKKFITVLLLSMCTLNILPAFAGDGTPIAKTEKPSNAAHAQQVLTRLIEIRDMDKSNLTSSEKKALRKELKEMKKEIRKNSNGIYLSVGAIIVVILLLILILR